MIIWSKTIKTRALSSPKMERHSKEVLSERYDANEESV